MPKTVIVPLDGSEFAERALPTARAYGERTNAKILLTTSRVGGVVEQPHEYLADAARRAGIVGADCVPVHDRSAAPAIQLLAGDASDPVVCMTTHGRSGLGHALLGSVAEEALGCVQAPFLLVGPGVEPERAVSFETVVVCTDGSAVSEAIIPEAARWVTDLHLRTWVVQVIDPEWRQEVARSNGALVVEEGLVHVFAEALMLRDGAGINWDVLHAEHVVDAVVDYASRVPASLVAMATHGRTGFARFSLGSIAASVVHRAACPVLVVRPDGLRDQEADAGVVQESEPAPRA